MPSNFDSFLKKHKFAPLSGDVFIPSVDTIELQINKLERELEIPEEEIINDDNLEAPDA